MFKIFLLILTTSAIQASNCMTEVPKPGGKSAQETQHIHPEEPYARYHLKNPSNRKARAEYRCGCSGKTWKQDAAKAHACPYCGPSMPDCGSLVKVISKKNETYSMEDYDLPNKLCPVSSEPIESTAHSVMHKGKQIFVCCRKCKVRFGKNPEKYMKKLPLKPEKFGFSKPESTSKKATDTKSAKSESHENHDDHDHHDHHDH
mgnify:CR=1 FL=1